MTTGGMTKAGMAKAAPLAGADRAAGAGGGGLRRFRVRLGEARGEELPDAPRATGGLPAGGRWRC
ncbi:hypothetical protein [Amycolatopsis granulosa]|uniref:hypothetical protein n=1 Tax=Amycolatopsis granulosa TaxID=185684 RepID=UPI001420A66D|nr:hypothetical protein [Amycolatopsis granulosa]NIH88170.1 hypothetical protein [Amycolatopsis granulosa]